jgi:uncharacterized membrane protein
MHLLAVVHWIGGVFFVTAILLPAIRRIPHPSRRIDLFETLESRFSLQAKVSVIIAGASGLYMVYRLDAWSRFLDPAAWWMPAMLLVWSVFALMLFVAEPFFLHAWFRRRAERDADGTFALIQRFHWLLLAISLVTVAGALAGAHGFAF